MTDLAAWLLEQIAEDERVAEAEDRDYYSDRPGYREEWRP